MVDEDNKVIIDSPETVAGLEYGKRLYREFHPRNDVLARPVQQ